MYMFLQVWTDLRGRTKKKIAMNKNCIRQTGGGPFQEVELSPIEQTVDNIVKINVAANPSGTVLGLDVLPHSSTNSDVNPIPLNDNDIVFVSSNEMDSTYKGEENPHNTVIKGLGKRRRQPKNEKTKMAKLADKNTEALEKLTNVVENLTTSVKDLLKIIENKMNQ